MNLHTVIATEIKVEIKYFFIIVGTLEQSNLDTQ